MKFILLLIVLLATPAFAEVAVIVHPSNSSVVDAESISRLFLGKSKSLADGTSMVPVNQDPKSAAAEEFNKKVLSKSASQLKAYWSQLVFTGKGTPPKEFGNDAEVKALVADNPNIIGYINAEAVDGTVKVVATF